MHKFYTLLLICGLVAYNNAYPGDRNEILCSIKLNEALSLICSDSGYNLLIPQKRSSLNLFDYVDMDSNEAMANALLNSIYSEHPLGSLASTKRHSRGIVDECCKQKCTYDELHTYCRSV